MGRPPDKFAWQHAVKLRPGWKCNYCNGKFKGGAWRVKKHLSGTGGDISPCEKVPKGIRNMALKIIRKKRLRSSSPMGEDSDGIDAADPSEEIMRNTAFVDSEMANSSLGREMIGVHSVDMASASVELSSFLKNPFPCSSNDYRITQNRPDEELVTLPLVKFMFKKPPFDSDFVKDPDFMEFLRMVAQHGVPLSLLQGDSLPIDRSLVNFKNEVNQHMLAVKESWKTTGCTLLVFNLNQKKEKGRCVLGFYCPKGIIFCKAPDVLSVGNISDVLKGLPPGSDIGSVTHVIGHPKQYWAAVKQVCEFSDPECNNDGCCNWEKVSCVRHEIKLWCMEICSKSDWAQDLIKKAKEIRQRIVQFNLCNWYYQTLDSKGLKEFAGGELENPLSRFVSIILLENDLKRRLSEPDFSHLDEAKAIIDDSNFWGEGRELKRALSPLLKIPGLMDTLVPTAGYIEMLLKEAKRMILNDDQRPRKSDPIWNRVAFYLDEITSFASRHPVAAYLNPGFCWSLDAQETLRLKEIVKVRLKQLFHGTEREKICEELECYSNKPSSPFLQHHLRLKNTHPVKSWELWGHALPRLRKYAIQVLCQPVCCLSNQIQKHMFDCEVEGDFILNLNVRMMEEFRNMGDNIYKPIDFTELYAR